MKFSALSAALLLPLSQALRLTGSGGQSYRIIPETDKRAPNIRDFVTWDEHSLFIRGERAMMFSGEVHPFRLPVPSLYIDLMEKIKALGFNLVSFYVDWALVEGKPGEFRADGIFALEPFFRAAKEAGIYLLARPGPYINAEVSGGGFPGYLQRLKGVLRSQAPDFLNATDNYMANVCKIIAQHQITNGGPIVLFQPENEYSFGHNIPFPNGQYMQYVINQARSAGVSVPMINNDVGPYGYYAPGSGVGAMDIYGHDNYPLGFDCANPTVWPANSLPTNFHQLHLKQSPKTPYAIVEFQGGSYDPWGGPGFEKCAALVNNEFSRVFYKNNLAAGITIFSLYMIFGGTNWGNLGHPGGYTSYDYGACIRENRVIDRENYAEIKLQGQFLKVSPGYITSSVGAASTSLFSDNAGITVTPLTGNKTGNYFIARQTDHTATGTLSYTLKLPTANGTLTIPQRGGTLSLHGRDSKIHLTDYPVGDSTLLYTTAEVFTWKKYADKTVLILYGGPDELHEFAVSAPFEAKVTQVEGDNISARAESFSIVVQWRTGPKRQFVRVGNLAIYLVDRNTAYTYWVPLLPGPGASQYGTSLMNPEAVIVAGAYLIRSASLSGTTLSIRADFNGSTPLEVIGFPPTVNKVSVNGKLLKHTTTATGTLLTQPEVNIPRIQLPELATLSWYSVDSLPEVQVKFDDSRWPVADKKPDVKPEATYKVSNFTVQDASPVSLYGSDYGFNTGTLVFRGHFTSTGSEKSFRVWTTGGTAYASSVWLNDRFLGSFKNSDRAEDANSTYNLPNLRSGQKCVLTVVVDSMGLNENLNSGYDDMKVPRGIFSYTLEGGADISTWKLTGNLGGESYVDKFRGPLNEGGLFFERQGFHYPSPPVDSFVNASSPLNGVDRAGITYYTANMPLNLPSETHDIPLSFVFASPPAQGGDYRALLYVNGFQFGKYVSNIGPQTEFPVPEGILNYKGDNWIGLALWALDDVGAKVPGFTLKAGTPVQSSRRKVEFVRGPSYSKRQEAY